MEKRNKKNYSMMNSKKARKGRKYGKIRINRKHK